ncbi:MAG: DUF4381 domain-containing protein [Methylococcaceae bacterium]
MPNGQIPIKDIHLPHAVSWWPPAIGWWVLLGLIVVFIGAILWFVRRRRRYALNKIAKQQLLQISEDTSLGDHQKIIEISMLLRRVALSAFPRADVASLTGSKWLAFLDHVLGGSRFSDGPGKFLAEAPYRKIQEGHLEPIVELAQAWLNKIIVEKY